MVDLAKEMDQEIRSKLKRSLVACARVLLRLGECGGKVHKYRLNKNMNLAAKLLLRTSLSFLMALVLFSVVAEVLWFIRGMSASRPTVSFVPFQEIPLFYLSYFSFGISNMYIVICSTLLWFMGWTVYLFLRLTERSRGVEFKFLSAKYLVFATWLFALANLAFGMVLATLIIFITLPLIFLPIGVPRKTSKPVDVESVRLG